MICEQTLRVGSKFRFLSNKQAALQHRGICVAGNQQIEFMKVHALIEATANKTKPVKTTAPSES